MDMPLLQKSQPLHQLALAQAFAPSHVVAQVGAEGATHAAWVRRVQSWCARFQSIPGHEIALFFDDALELSCALWGAWHAGKMPVLASDMQPATLELLLPSVSAATGLLPDALQPDEDGADAVRLTPFDMHAQRLALFTSGSTGKPTRIVKQVAQLDAEVHALQREFGSLVPAQDARVLATVSHQHIYGLLFRVLWPLAAGRALGCDMARYPEDILQSLQTLKQAGQRAVLVSSPALLSRLPDNLDWADVRNQLTAVFSSGGPLTAQASAHALAVLGQSPTEVFGSSETGGIAWRRRAEQGDAWQVLPGVQVRLNDEGLLCVRSPHLADAHTWWETADRAQPSGDGAGFVLQGRVDRIVKMAEKRVSLTAMEQCLQASAWVSGARAVLIEPAADLPVRIGMVVELSEAGWSALTANGRRAMAERLRALLIHDVERVALPRHWRYVARMPMNAQGKITQSSLLALFAPLTPRPHWLERSADAALAQLHVDPGLRVLDGHFPQAALVPGVAQLHWVVELARQAFGITAPLPLAQVVKFQQPILPGDCVQMRLVRLADGRGVQFTLTSGRGAHASGKLLQRGG
ncbi:AMP-binding protein [Diaphorobacter sp.]|uniref:AMP-binding protein n=1 Tax=Diaphorobacter sp. TaxID=1934310 RepID=UPI0028A604B7|nr:AMP-binding protein [Diaphorobacter sp.]